MHWDFHQEIVRENARQLARDLHVAELRRTRRPPAPTEPVVLRLCKVSDDDALARLAAFERLTVSRGRHVVAEVDGEVVAAWPVSGGQVLADPFRKTAHLLPLLELRAKQLDSGGRRGLSLGFRSVRRGWSRA